LSAANVPLLPASTSAAAAPASNKFLMCFIGFSL
jgi:hypothetical protein